MQVASNQYMWKSKGETYVQQWTSYGSDDGRDPGGGQVN